MTADMTVNTTVGEWHYARTDLIEGLKQVGLVAGDTVFVHVCLDSLGQAKDHADLQQRNEMLLGALREILTDKGTLLIPTYTFSFTKQQVFDIQRTATEGGPWSTSADFLEYFRQQPGVIRSADPIHSVAGVGPQAEKLLTNIPATCFGKDSVFDRLKQINGKVITIGIGLHEATFQHHIEEMVGVPFRFKKMFSGYIRDNGAMRKTGWLYNVRILADNGYPDGSRLEQKAYTEGVCKIANVGCGEIWGVETQPYFEFTAAQIKADRWFTAKGPAVDPVVLEQARVNEPRFDVQLPENASMEQMIDAIWKLPRQIVSQAYDDALIALSKQVPMTIHEYPTGTESWSWIIPERWTCYEAYLETLDGKRLLSYADNPLHVVSYSLPFEGEVSRQELFQHLFVHPLISDAIPFIFKYYERDWGLCCSKQLKDTLTEDRYRVVIRTTYSYSTLKVGEVVIPGETDETIVLCSHLCHPAMVNDDLSGVVVGIDVVRALLQKKNLHYTYRYVIVPETIGTVAYLSHNEDLIPKMKGGLFLEMLGLEYPHALQLSFDGATEVDQCFTLAMKQRDFHGWTGAFRTVIGNDERQYNAPGVRVPMLSLSRVLPTSSPEWPYRQYHSSHDNPDCTSIRRLEESRDLVLGMIDALENNYVPVNNFKGEVFCSRYGIHIDDYVNPAGHKALFDIMFLIDGTRTIADIANTLHVSFDAVKQTIDVLCKPGLVEYMRKPEQR